MEANLIDRIGDAGKKLHTGRSRNDQVALDMRLYVRQELLEIDGCLKDLLETLITLMEENLDTYMPGMPICRRRSLPRWHTIWELTLKCLKETGFG